MRKTITSFNDIKELPIDEVQKEVVLFNLLSEVIESSLEYEIVFTDEKLKCLSCMEGIGVILPEGVCHNVILTNNPTDDTPELKFAGIWQKELEADDNDSIFSFLEKQGEECLNLKFVHGTETLREQLTNDLKDNVNDDSDSLFRTTITNWNDIDNLPISALQREVVRLYVAMEISESELIYEIIFTTAKNDCESEQCGIGLTIPEFDGDKVVITSNPNSGCHSMPFAGTWQKEFGIEEGISLEDYLTNNRPELLDLKFVGSEETLGEQFKSKVNEDNDVDNKETNDNNDDEDVVVSGGPTDEDNDNDSSDEDNDNDSLDEDIYNERLTNKDKFLNFMRNLSNIDFVKSINFILATEMEISDEAVPVTITNSSNENVIATVNGIGYYKTDEDELVIVKCPTTNEDTLIIEEDLRGYEEFDMVEVYFDSFDNKDNTAN